MNKEILLTVEDLKTYFFLEDKTAKAVDGISFEIYQDEILGIVGESGSGKSVTSLSILRLIPQPPGKIVNGKIIFENNDILKMTNNEIRKIRGNEIAMIFQEPMTSLNPVLTIFDQISEPLILHKNMSKKEAKEMTVNLLEMVGIPGAKKRLNEFPHQFSGGMRQRVMIAMALACDPMLLIADEPTTALDVTIQAEILELMLDLKEKKAKSSVLLITHDLAVIAETCDRVIVMYCGKIQEKASTKTLFDNPLHPYTQGLLKSIPSIETRQKKLYAIPGNVPGIYNLPAGCSFSTRCPHKMDICEKIVPGLIEVEKGHFTRCHLYNKAE